MGLLNFGLDYEPLAAALERIKIIPVNRQVCSRLSFLDFQSDPADEIIAATSLAYQIPLMTRDSRILASRLLKFP
jgi:PIN domain nuclease of toxin-antitoxin system